MKDISLVILCGGKGTRLGKLTKSTPKPFLNISHKKFKILFKKKDYVQQDQ